MSAEKVKLGRYLFYDTRLSVNGNESCASCHRQELAFTDGRARAKGTTGQLHPRSSMSLVNVAYAPALTWADPKLVALEDQALVPMFGTEPVELGLKGQEERVLGNLRRDAVYGRLFAAAFPGDSQPFRIENLTKALAAFERTIISTRSPYDRYRYGGDETALSRAAKRGERLFFSGEKAGCFQCHGGWNFSGPVRCAGGPRIEPEFHNTALYDVYRAPNTGLERHTGKIEDAYMAPLRQCCGASARGTVPLSMTFLPTRTVTWAITSPSRISTTFPLNWFLAEIGITGLYHSRELAGREALHRFDPTCREVVIHESLIRSVFAPVAGDPCRRGIDCAVHPAG